MKKFFLALGVSLMCYSSFGTSDEGQHTSYKVGNQNCPSFEEAKHKYDNKEDYYDDEEDYIRLALIYAMCLVIKGEQTNNKNDVNRGMEILHYHADQQANIVANFMIAQYHFTGGTFEKISKRNLDVAVDYFSRTLAIIKTYSNYPNDIYAPWEKYHNMELSAHYRMPRIYLDMFYWGFAGDYRLRLLNSSSYEGDQDLETYPEYNKNIEAYIDLAIEHARNCRVLPKKQHFDRVREYIEACTVIEEKAKILKQIQIDRNKLLNQDECKQDINLCPEINELNEELVSTHLSMNKETGRIFSLSQQASLNINK